MGQTSLMSEPPSALEGNGAERGHRKVAFLIGGPDVRYTFFDGMPTACICLVTLARTGAKRRQEVVAIFGTKPPCVDRSLNDGDKDVAA